MSTLLITGASSGIGYACACLAIERFERIIITGRDPQKLQTVCDDLGSSVQGLVLDQSDASSVAAFQEHLPQLTHVVANVGVNPVHDIGPKKIAKTPLDTYKSAFNTNIVHMLMWLQPLLTGMKGKIVLVGSQAYQHKIPGQSPYAITKAALVGVKNSIDAEYGHKGLGCDLVNPGVVANERTARLRKRLASSGQPDNPLAVVTEQDVAKRIIQCLMEEETGREFNI